ncbi:unnamed protein product [Cylicocyclus nassatus]|uniref:Uncharacterized protein n=1 Tax=Cylicocyclus nassatus TaxID=53992 RepID=A0AA36H2C3_CYLNA|nr:unnamed protein product [Cylicocyclus nassatus]
MYSSSLVGELFSASYHPAAEIVYSLTAAIAFFMVFLSLVNIACSTRRNPARGSDEAIAYVTMKSQRSLSSAEFSRATSPPEKLDWKFHGIREASRSLRFTEDSTRNPLPEVSGKEKRVSLSVRLPTKTKVAVQMPASDSLSLPRRKKLVYRYRRKKTPILYHRQPSSVEASGSARSGKSGRNSKSLEDSAAKPRRSASLTRLSESKDEGGHRGRKFKVPDKIRIVRACDPAYVTLASLNPDCYLQRDTRKMRPCY